MIRLIPILLGLALATSLADTITLKSGKTVEGRVIRSNDETITVAVNFTPTIIDEQTLQRADIASIAVTTDDEIAFAKIADVRPPDTELAVADCQKIIDRQLQPFLQQFPNSPRAEAVRKLIAPLQADIARLRSGDVKVAGTWYDKASIATEKYQIEAATILEAMKQQIDAKNFIAAANNFDTLQHMYPNSTAYADGFRDGYAAVEKLGQQLDYELGNMPLTMARRQAVIDRTPPEQRQPIQQAILAEDARAAAVAALAQKNQQHYFTIFSFDQKGLKAMQSSQQQFIKQLAAIDAAELEQKARLARRINKELSEREYVAAEATLAQLKAAWPTYEALSRIDQRLKAIAAADKTAKEQAKANPLR